MLTSVSVRGVPAAGSAVATLVESFHSSGRGVHGEGPSTWLGLGLANPNPNLTLTLTLTLTLPLPYPYP